MNPSRKSRHYVRQSNFKGSRRELRGALVRALVSGPKRLAFLVEATKREEDEVIRCLDALEEEGMIELLGGIYSIAEK
jgi:A/G-specific adenine glycosylase